MKRIRQIMDKNWMFNGPNYAKSWWIGQSHKANEIIFQITNLVLFNASDAKWINLEWILQIYAK